jgi:arylsulfatase A
MRQFLISLTAGLFLCGNAAAETPPNILLILADDLGYGDVGCYNEGAKVPTPNIDRLAGEGMRFTDAHSPATVCTPTRYSLMTGQMAFRVPNGGVVFTGAGGPSLIAPGRLTLASMLKQQGYATAVVGKWHIGLTFRDSDGNPIHEGGIEAVRRIDFSRRVEGGPLDHGFDRFFGTACCPTTDWLYAFIDNDRVPVPPTKLLDRSKLPGHPYAQDCREGLIAPDFPMEEVDMLFLRKSREFLAQHVRSSPQQPFFLFHSTQAVHLPSFAGRDFQGKTRAGPHGDFIFQFDHIVGELMRDLDEHGLAQNTLVILTSDNGPETTSVVHMRADYGHDGAKPWRGVKRDAWEGGHRVPFIVRWPARVPAGTTSDQLVCLTDIMATVASITGAELPHDAAEDSFDFLPALEGTATGPIRPYLLTQAFRGAHTLSIRRGNWKYIDHPGSGGNRYDRGVMAPYALPETDPDAPAQLYDLAIDPGETTNLIPGNPKSQRNSKVCSNNPRPQGAVGREARRQQTRVMNLKRILMMLSIAMLTASAGATDEVTVATLRERAEKGDASAQLSLAIRYRDGKDVEKDPAEAMRWGHLAADQGYAEAMDFVGFMFFRGVSVVHSPDIAAGYFKAAADRSAQAAWNLGQCYFAAQGVEQDVPRALEIWDRAAGMGHGRAAAVAAMAWLAGDGIAADPEKARRLAERAVELGDPSGHVVLGEMHFQAGGLDRARELWTKVAAMHPTRPTSNPEQPSGEMASQQGADLLRLMDLRQRKPEPGRFGLAPAPHLLQGWNNCGATSCAIYARALGGTVGGWDFKKLCPSPLGTGTDWAHLVEAAEKIGQRWKLVTFTADDAGFAEATAFARTEIDAGRPVVIDFKFISDRYRGGSAGHTLLLAGYIADEDLYILCNPAIATPGLHLMSAADLDRYWRSDGYSKTSGGVLSRPAIVVDPAGSL